MKCVLLRMCAAALTVLATFHGSAEPVTMSFVVSVSESTCDIRFTPAGDGPGASAHRVALGYFTPRDFSSNRVRLAGNDALIMRFPERECAGKNLKVRVDGPAARGARGRNWGDARRELNWGLRLNWEENGISGRYPLTPSWNTLALTVPSGRLQKAGSAVHTVVLRPELRTWDHRNVVAGTSLSVPLIFSVLYE
ncbi:hypothetical protein [Enterobacter asburiae]|uniref:hypothetical protein n=1 Tax=Enterobacter asburiae TaxID=61645 RepID=UPI000F87E411|nr:hypothetical protein [Enterobacter asburiae]